MSERQKISRKKSNTSNQSNPSLKPNIPSLATPSHNVGLESNRITPQTIQLETSQKQELAVEQIENQENISLKESSKESVKESAFDSTNYLEKVNFIPRHSVQPQILDALTEIPKESIQRQELKEEKEENQEKSEVIQTKLNASEATDTDKQEKVSIWHKAFQIQRSEESKLDKPIESFNYLEKASIFRPKESVQRQELEEDKEENQATSGVIQAKCSECESEGQQEDELVQTKLTVGEPGDKYEQEADSVAAKVVEQINSPSSEETVQGKVEPVVTQVMRQGGVNFQPLLQRQDETSPQFPPGFDPDQKAQELHQAFDGWGTDERKVLDILW
ncbi:MAG: hypothetical protein SWZ49_08555, partial [Cyanobacteriota bacterium]|nr:hypothetical protein [Cyanobacteriota bacterium]